QAGRVRGPTERRQMIRGEKQIRMLGREPGGKLTRRIRLRHARSPLRAVRAMERGDLAGRANASTAPAPHTTHNQPGSPVPTPACWTAWAVASWTSAVGGTPAALRDDNALVYA